MAGQPFSGGGLGEVVAGQERALAPAQQQAHVAPRVPRGEEQRAVGQAGEGPCGPLPYAEACFIRTRGCESPLSV